MNTGSTQKIWFEKWKIHRCILRLDLDVRVLTMMGDTEVVAAAPGGGRHIPPQAFSLVVPSVPRGWSGSPPRLRSSRRWPGRRWRPARERCAREARDCPLPRRRRQTQSRPRGSRPGRGPELEPRRDPCRRNSNTGWLHCLHSLQ